MEWEAPGAGVRDGLGLQAVSFAKMTQVLGIQVAMGAQQRERTEPPRAARLKNEQDG